MSSSQKFDQVLVEWVQVYMRRSMQAFARWMTESGLSRSQIGALMRLHYQGRCPVTGIGTELGITTPAASQLVDRLVHMGLIDRTKDPTDRRVKLVALSEDGRALIHQGLVARLGWMEELAASLPAAEQQAITHALSALVEAAHQINGDSETAENGSEHN